MRTALIIEWTGEGKATLVGVSDPFILLDPDLFSILGIDKPGTYNLSEAKLRITDDSTEPWKGTLEVEERTYRLEAHRTSAFLGSETYTLRLASP